jgi:hypothetical protein
LVGKELREETDEMETKQSCFGKRVERAIMVKKCKLIWRATEYVD